LPLLYFNFYPTASWVLYLNTEIFICQKIFACFSLSTVEQILIGEKQTPLLTDTRNKGIMYSKSIQYLSANFMYAFCVCEINISFFYPEFYNNSRTKKGGMQYV